ncbi:G-D-S-L family lipolytic protein [Cellulosimicrobium terreum]|nr:G-D-S-L family lipolytic protein [Cellulosimicrobium terreum]
MLPSERDVRVCFVGDSYVAGIGDETALGWVGRVVAASAARGRPLTAYNLGVRRDTTALVADRVAREVPPRLVGAAEPRVVVSSGVNDTVLEDGAPRLDTAGSVAALRRLGEGLTTTPLLVVGPVAVADPEHDRRVARLDVALRAEATRLGARYVALHERTGDDDAWRREVRAGDGFHPGAAGYEMLADLLAGPVLDWLG